MKVTSKETFALKGQKCTYASEEQDIWIPLSWAEFLLKGVCLTWIPQA